MIYVYIKLFIKINVIYNLMLHHFIKINHIYYLDLYTINNIYILELELCSKTLIINHAHAAMNPKIPKRESKRIPNATLEGR